MLALPALFALAACSENSFNSPDASPKGSASATNTPPLTGDGAPPGGATPTPVPTGTPPFQPNQVAKIFVTITAPGPTEIALEIDLDQAHQTYAAQFTETILGTSVGGCTAQGAAADFTQLNQALGAVRVGSPTTSLQGLADATLKVVLLDGGTLTFQLSLTDLGTDAVSATIPMAQANQLIAYIDQLQVSTHSCDLH